jgi:hypothetical protein
LVAEKSADPFYRAVGFKESGQAYLKWVRQPDTPASNA